MSHPFYLGIPDHIYLASPKNIYLASTKSMYLSSPRFYLSSPPIRSEYDKEVWREYIKSRANPNSYAEKVLKDVEEMNARARELREKFDEYAKDIKARVKAREARIWGKWVMLVEASI